MVERRKYPRYEYMYKVVYTTLHNPFKRIVAASCNVSLGGIALRLRKVLGSGERLSMKIYPHKRMPAVIAEGKVVWHSESERRLGVQFTSIPWSGAKMLTGKTI